MSKVCQMRLHVDRGGRIVLPAACRRALGIQVGDDLIARLEDGELRLMTVAEAVRRAQALVRRAIPDGPSLADELLTDRRAEADRE